MSYTEALSKKKEDESDYEQQAKRIEQFWEAKAPYWLPCKYEFNVLYSWQYTEEEIEDYFEKRAKKKDSQSTRDIDIVHYIGHAKFEDTLDNESSGGYIYWGEHRLKPKRFAKILGGGPTPNQDLSHINFIFLGCCEGAASESYSLFSTPPRPGDIVLNDRDDYGILEWLAYCKAPLVLGFRWEVYLPTVSIFAKEFYRIMFIFKEELPIVLWRTREEMRYAMFKKDDQGEEDRRSNYLEDPIWASALIIHQHPTDG